MGLKRYYTKKDLRGVPSEYAVIGWGNTHRVDALPSQTRDDSAAPVKAVNTGQRFSPLSSTDSSNPDVHDPGN